MCRRVISPLDGARVPRGKHSFVVKVASGQTFIDRLNRIMPNYCCVPYCKEKKGGHKFPKDDKQRLLWRVAVKRVFEAKKKLWEPGPYDVVCCDHFLPSDYNVSLLGERRRLKDGAVPSVFTFSGEKPQNSQRGDRLAKRQRIQSEIRPDLDNICQEEVVTTTVFNNRTEVTDVEEPRTNDMETECYLLTDANTGYSVDNFELNNKVIKYYTGFENHQHFMLLFHILGPAVNSLSYNCKSLAPKDQLFMTLMKLRQAKDDLELSLLFHVSETTVSNVVVTWINFLYFQLKDLDFWPSRQIVDDHMPSSFGKSFRRTRVILDATETPINKPSNINAQSCTFSTYKNRNTLKAMIGCTPRGLISYVSDAYGGSASDRQIIERSELLSEPERFNKQDSIMADRGIMVQDLFAMRDVYVNTTTMLKGKSQLEADEIVRDRRIASKRIHIERVIGLSKRFKILAKPLAPSKVNLGSRIIYVCFMLSNFRPSIVSAMA